MTITTRKYARALTLLVSAGLAACGGGGGGDDGGGGSAEPTLSIASAMIDEGDVGQSQLEFTVTLNPAAAAAVTVDYATTDASADNSDYVAATGQVTINAGVTSATVAVDVLGDTVIEADETLTMTLSNPSNAVLGTASATGTVVNDDFPQLSISDASVVEGDTGVTSLSFAITMDLPAVGDVTVDYVSSDVIATAGDDYTAVNDTLTIPEGDTLATVVVDIATDTLIEPDEQFVVNLLNPSPNVEIADDEGIGLITNDDLTRLSLGSGSAVETDSGTRLLTVPLTLSDPASDDITVDVVTSDGTATAGIDYVALSTTATITAGDTSADIALEVVGDTVIENSEAFNLTISNVQGPGVIEREISRPIIIDNDGPASDPQVFGFGAAVTEGDSGTSTMTFLLFLDTAQTSDITLDYATANGTAVAPGDYLAANGTVTFAAGETEATVDVEIVGDTDDESDESFSLLLTNASTGIVISSPTLSGTIGDDDQPPAPPSIAIINAQIEEGDVGTVDLVFTVTLSGASDTIVTADYETDEDTATADVDYTTSNGTVVFPIGSVSQTLIVPIIGDTFTEDDERFRVILSNLTGNVTPGRLVATGFIRTDEPFTSVSIGNASQLEGDAGTSDLEFTIGLSVASASVTTFDYQTADDTATAGEDYISASGTVQIAAGDTSATIAVTVSGDTDNEPDEAFTVTLSNLSINASFDDNVARGTLTNDDGSPGWQSPQNLGAGRTPSLAMDSQGRGAGIYVTAPDPLVLDDTITVALFDGGAWQAPEDVRVVESVFDPPKVAMLDAGRVLALYRFTNMETAIYTPGQGWVSQEVAATHSFNFDLASIESGDAIVVWEQPGNNQDPTDILRNTYTQATDSWSGPELVEIEDLDRARIPQTAMDDAGNVMILWSQPLTGTHFSYYDATLDQWTAPTDIPALQFTQGHSIAMLGDGRVIVGLRQRGVANNPDSVEAWIYDPVTDDWTITGPVETSADENALQAVVSVDPAGNVIIAWLQQPTSGFRDVMVNRYDAALDQWDGPQNIEGGDGNVISSVSLDTDAAGNAIAVWSQDVGPTGQRHFRIRASRYTAADDTWSPPEQIDDETVTTGAISPSVGLDDAGNAIVIWDYTIEDEIGVTRFTAP